MLGYIGLAIAIFCSFGAGFMAACLLAANKIVELERKERLLLAIIKTERDFATRRLGVRF